MAVRIQLRRGNNSEFSTGLVLAAGEAALVEDEKVLIVGDGTSTYNDLKGAGKFINYQTEQGLGVVGGAHGTGETPLTVKGVGSQTAAILKVTDSSDGVILQISDDEEPTVRFEDHGATNEVFMLLKQQSGATANAFELQAGGDTDTQFSISCDGEVAITPTNDQTADAPSLDVKGSGANNSGILRVKDNSNNAVLTVKSDGVESEQTVTVDGGSIIAQVEDTAASNVTITASATDTDKVVTVDGASGTENLSITAGGAVTSEGKGTFADAEIDVTGRSLGAASVLRRDEILSSLSGFKKYQYNLSGLNNSTEAIVKLTATSDSSSVLDYKVESIDSIVARTTAVNTTSPDPDLQFTPASDVFEAIRLKPNEIARFNISCAFSHSSFSRTTKITTIRYSSADLVTGKTDLTEALVSQTGSGTFTLDHTYLNTTSSDIFIALSSECSTTTARDITGDVFVGVAAPIAVATSFTALT